MGLGADLVDPGVGVPLDDPSGAGRSDGANWKRGPREGFFSTGTAIHMPILQFKGVLANFSPIATVLTSDHGGYQLRSNYIFAFRVHSRRCPFDTWNYWLGHMLQPVISPTSVGLWQSLRQSKLGIIILSFQENGYGTGVYWDGEDASPRCWGSYLCQWVHHKNFYNWVRCDVGLPTASPPVHPCRGGPQLHDEKGWASRGC